MREEQRVWLLQRIKAVEHERDSLQEDIAKARTQQRRLWSLELEIETSQRELQDCRERLSESLDLCQHLRHRLALQASESQLESQALRQSSPGAENVPGAGCVSPTNQPPVAGMALHQREWCCEPNGLGAPTSSETLAPMLDGGAGVSLEVGAGAAAASGADSLALLQAAVEIGVSHHPRGGGEDQTRRDATALLQDAVAAERTRREEERERQQAVVDAAAEAASAAAALRDSSTPAQHLPTQGDGREGDDADAVQRVGYGDKEMDAGPRHLAAVLSILSEVRGGGSDATVSHSEATLVIMRLRPGD